MTHVLVVDVGKTGCRAVVRACSLDPGSDRSHGDQRLHEVPGAPGLATADGVDRCAEAVVRAAGAALEAAAVDRVSCLGVGAAGALAAPGAAAELARRLLRTLPTRSVAVSSDAVTSHAGALGGAAGVVLAMGTGAVAVGIGDRGQCAVVDGWGPTLGDEGSGAWIGAAGLRAALRAHDGRGPETALQPAAVALLGPLASLPARLDAHQDDGSSPARVAATFAPEVARLAVEGDPEAGAVMAAAVGALAASVRAAAHRAGGVRALALTGGLTNLRESLVEPLVATLTEMRLSPSAGGSLEGAWLLATRTDTPHEQHVVRAA